MLSLRDPVHNTTTWAYDGLDRAISETNQLSDARTFDYDAVGNLIKKTDRNGRVIEYTYDNRYRNTHEIWKSGGATVRTIEFTHDAAGQMTGASDPSGTLAYVYDGLGRITSETQTIAGLTPTLAFAHTYDANSNRLTLSSTIGGTADFKNTYTYDNLDRMTRVVQEDVVGGNVVADKRVDFAYNALGQFTQIDRYQSTGTSNAVAQTVFSYDALNRLTAMDHKTNGGGTTLAGYDYTYDVGSRITSIDSFLDGLATYTYDNTDQLTGADHTGQTDESYSYDTNGNRTMTGYVVQANNRTTSDGTYNYEYDDEGNRTKRTKISDGSYEEYAWDHRNRLTGVTFKTSAGVVTKTVAHTYDLLDRWTRRSVDPDGPGAQAAVDTFFAYDGGSIDPVLQFNGAAASNLDHRYLWGPNVDQILADEDVNSLASAGNIIWPFTDHLGTANDLADHNESTGVTTVANHREFNSFGANTAESNPSVSSDIGFTGKVFDASTGFNYHYRRWLDVLLGQWASEDPIGFAGNDPSLRRYVLNSPLLHTDPTGLIPPQFGWPTDENGTPWYPHRIRPPKPIVSGPNDQSLASFLNGRVYVPSKKDQIEDLKKVTPVGTIDAPGVGTLGGQHSVFKKSALDKGKVVGTSGAFTCIGVIVIEPGAEGRIAIFHFVATDSPSATIGTLYKWKFRKHSRIIVFGGSDERGSCATLKEVLSHLEALGFDPEWLDSDGAWVDANGNVYVGSNDRRDK